MKNEDIKELIRKIGEGKKDDAGKILKKILTRKVVERLALDCEESK